MVRCPSFIRQILIRCIIVLMTGMSIALSATGIWFTCDGREYEHLMITSWANRIPQKAHPLIFGGFVSQIIIFLFWVAALLLRCVDVMYMYYCIELGVLILIDGMMILPIVCQVLTLNAIRENQGCFSVGWSASFILLIASLVVGVYDLYVQSCDTDDLMMLMMELAQDQVQKQMEKKILKLQKQGKPIPKALLAAQKAMKQIDFADFIE